MSVFLRTKLPEASGGERPKRRRILRRCSRLGASKTPKMLFCSHKQAIERECGCAFTGLVQRIAREQVELVAGFDHNDFACLGNANQPAIRPYRRSEVVASDPFLITNIAGPGIETSDYAGVAAKPRQLAHNDTGRDVRRGLFDLIRAFGFATDGGGRLYSYDTVPASAAATRTEDQVTRNNRRADAALVKSLLIFPEHFARIWIQSRNTMGLTVADQSAAAILRFEKTRRGISNDRAATRCLPDRLTGFRIDRNDRAFADTPVRHRTFDEFRIVLKIRQDHFVIANDWRGA